MPADISRRDFLKLSALSLTSLAFRWSRSVLPPEDQTQPVGIGRVTSSVIHVYSEPSFRSQRSDRRHRDQLIIILEEIVSPQGPQYNPLWYRIVGGFVHSGYLQRVENAHLNPPLSNLPENGQLGELTVPIAQSYLKTANSSWQPLYRLYYASIYWITHLVEGLDGKPWYGLTDDRLRVTYYLPAAYIRPISEIEILPLSPHVPEDEKKIVVSIKSQSLAAYEGDLVVFQASLSSGLPSQGPTINGIPTDTPLGNFNISLKMPSRHMGNGELTNAFAPAEYPGVPWVSTFVSTGVAFHGTYWHNNFGTRMSSGCINLRNEDANWIYRWTTPLVRGEEWYKLGRGTLIQVTE